LGRITCSRNKIRFCDKGRLIQRVFLRSFILQLSKAGEALTAVEGQEQKACLLKLS
jgi:hypothetical protein